MGDLRSLSPRLAARPRSPHLASVVRTPGLVADDRRGEREGASVQTYMGHSSIQVTYDKSGHLTPGNEEQAAGLLDGYLQRAAEEAARAGVVLSGA